MRLLLASALLLPACIGGQDTGPATLATNNGAPRAVSAWAMQPGDYLLGINGAGNAYIPWRILIGDVPVGTSCESGTGHGSLKHDASSWLVDVQIAVPYQQGADMAELSKLTPGPITVGTLSSVTPPTTAPLAGVQVFDESASVDVLGAGTLTITAFDDSGITGTLDATGSGATTALSATFTANRCDL